MLFFQLLATFAIAVIGFIHPVTQNPSHHIENTQVLAANSNSVPTVTPFPAATNSTTATIQHSISSITSPISPLIDCIEPDGKHIQLTQQACDNFNKAWHTTPTPTTATYGQATKISDHTYELQVQSDSSMAGTQEVFTALNTYRQKNGVGALAWNMTLANYAQTRATFFSSKGSLDGHAGFMDFINNQNGFSKLGFNHLGENAAYAGPLNGTHIIEEVFAADSEHNDNQLSSDWTQVGIGISGIETDIVFGSSPR